MHFDDCYTWVRKWAAPEEPPEKTDERVDERLRQLLDLLLQPLQLLQHRFDRKSERIFVA